MSSARIFGGLRSKTSKVDELYGNNATRQPTITEDNIASKVRDVERTSQPTGVQRMEETDARCSSLVLYFTEGFSIFGYGNQINTFILAKVVEAFLNRTLVIVEKLNMNQFGCPPKDRVQNPPSGLGRIISYTNKCSLPCTSTMNYDDWYDLAKKEGDDVGKVYSKCSGVSTIAFSGSSMRQYWWRNLRKILRMRAGLHD